MAAGLVKRLGNSPLFLGSSVHVLTHLPRPSPGAEARRPHPAFYGDRTGLVKIPGRIMAALIMEVSVSYM